MAKKAFKRPRMATPPRGPEPGFFRRDAASRAWFTNAGGQPRQGGLAATPWQEKINHSLWVWAASDTRAIPSRPTCKGIASRWLAPALALDRVTFMVQRFCKIT